MNTDVFRHMEPSKDVPPECAFSIVYGDNYETLDLIANSPDEANIWVTGLTFLTTMDKCES